MIDFPNISPIAVSFDALTLFGITIGPFAIHWYALAYLTGFLLAWGYAHRLNRLYGPYRLQGYKIDDFMTWAILGVILGGRLGYVLFYNLDAFLSDPVLILKVWQGGMSFHGGATGVILAILLYSWRAKVSTLQLADLVCAGVPIGLFLGRAANFINAELYGRVTNVPWAVVFPGSDGQPRHPSQIYEALGEGLILFILLYILMRVRGIRNRPGIVSAVFLGGYATCRFLVEFVREPDSQLGLLSTGLTMGQMLCLPMFVGAILVLFFARRRFA